MKMATRTAFGEEILEQGAKKNFVVLDADISTSTKTSDFHEKYPNRAYNMGIAEQNMIGTAVGIASTGIPVYAATYAVFASMRALEQIRTFICYPQLNVKIIASHGGLQVSSDGVSHQAVEDIAIMRSLANMTVVHPADSITTKKLIALSTEFEGPMYIRLMRNPVSNIYDEDLDFEVGKGIITKDEQDPDCTIFACGLMVEKSLKIAEELDQEGINVAVIDLHTIKPLDKDLVLKYAKKSNAVVTAEDHNIIGGLGGAVSELLGSEYPVPIERIGINDEFCESGDPEKLFSKYCMNTTDIKSTVKKVIKRKK